MKLFLIMQKEGHKQTRVREVYLNKQDAVDFIGTPHEPTIKCDDCGQQKRNPAYYDDATESWKRKLFILERDVI